MPYRQKRELRDELEVTGHVKAWKMMNRKEILSELNSIMDKWEKQGYKTPNQVPESETKDYYRQLLRSLGFDVRF